MPLSTVLDASEHHLYQLALTNFRRVLVYGPPGVGKTHEAVMTAKSRGEDYIKVTCTGGDMSAEYRGMFIPKGDVFEFMYGALTAAWTHNGGEGCRLVLDEIDHAPEEVHSILHAGLDDPNIAGMTLPSGEFITPGPKFSVVGTMNGHPADLPDPLQDRFEAKIKVTQPSEEALRLLPDDLRKSASQMIGHSDPDRRVSFRSLLAFSKVRSRVGDSHAAQMVFGERWNEVLTALKLGA